MSDILKLFEGLTSEQVRELRSRIVPELERLREEITQEQETKTMTEQNFWDSLTDEEKAEASAGIEALQKQIEGRRASMRQAELNLAFNREMRVLMNRRATFEEKQRVKAKYQAQGLTDFSAREVPNG